MTWLDCHTHESALDTVAAAIKVSGGRLTEAILSTQPDLSGTIEVDPIEQFPRDVLRRVGVELEQVELDGALLFHGTRLADTESVRSGGLRPLSQRLEAIWEMLGDLARPELSKDAWLAFRRWVEAGGGGYDGFQYRLKTGDAMHDGPFAVLVKDTLLRPRESCSHDYLDCPEIVQDICRCHGARFGSPADLEARFKDATAPCIVTFRRAGVESQAIGPAIWFIRARLLGGSLDLSTSCGFPPRPVPPNDVVAVDVAGEATEQTARLPRSENAR